MPNQKPVNPCDPKPRDPSKPPTPEEEFSKKLDVCLTDGVIKTGAGVILGALTSVLFFKRRRWPIIGGMGTGIGIAWANCEFALNNMADNKA